MAGEATRAHLLPNGSGKIRAGRTHHGEIRLRGIAIIKADSREEAQRIASGDRLVQNVHLVVEVHPIILEDLSSIRFK